MATVELRYSPKDTAWFTANATMILKAGEPAYHETTGLFKLGDGTTQLSALPFLPATGGGGGNFVPYTGATGDVDLGEYELKAGQIELDQTPTGTASVAVTRWNDTNGLTETTLKGGSVIIKNGIDLVARVVNKVTPNATLTKAQYQVVKISGAQGQRLAVGLAQANNDNNSADTLGVAIETITTNQEGFIMCVGVIENINTTGSLQGETWADGDVLYLSPTTAGAITKVKPTGLTGHIVVVGYVEYAHANNGKIYVKVMNGWELDELHNVYINAPADNEVLTYENATSLWKNKTVVSALGYTPYNSTNPSGFVTTSGVPYTGATGDVNLGAYKISSTGAAITITSPNNFLVSGSGGEALKITAADYKAQLYAGGGINYPVLTCNSMLTYGISFAFSGYRVGIVANNSMVAGFNNSEVTFTPLAATSGAVTSFNITPSANTGQTASTNIPSFKITGNTKTWATGALTNQYFSYLSSNTIAFAGASTVTNAFNLYVDEVTAGTNATITNNYGIGCTNLYIKSRSTSTSNKALHIRNTAQSADFLYVRGDGFTFVGDVQVGNGLGSGTFHVYGNQGQTSDIVRIFSSNSVNIFEFRQASNNALMYLRSSTGTLGVQLTGQSGGTNYIDGVVSIGSTTSVTSAVMNVDSTTKGFLPPRMTTTQKNAIATPAAGLIVYDTTTNKACCYDGTIWNDLF